MDAKVLRELDLSFMVGRRELLYIPDVFDRGFGRTVIPLTRRFISIINAFAVLTNILLWLVQYLEDLGTLHTYSPESR